MVGHSTEVPDRKREEIEANKDNEIDVFADVPTRPKHFKPDYESPDPPNIGSQLDGGPKTSQTSGPRTSDCTDHQGSQSPSQVPRKTYPARSHQHPDYYRNS